MSMHFESEIPSKSIFVSKNVSLQLAFIGLLILLLAYIEIF